MKQIKHMKQIKNFLLTLCLIMAGAQSAKADTIYDFSRDTVPVNGVNFETIYLSSSSTFSLISSDLNYFASVISIPSGSTSISVPSKITIDNKAYEVRSVGKHTYLKGYPTRYFFDSSVPTTYGWGSEWKDDTGYHNGPNRALDTDVEYSAVPINFSNSGLKNLTFQGGIEIYGPFTSNSLETLNFKGDATIKGDMLVVGLRNLNLKGALDISGTLTSDRLTEIHFNKLTCSGKFNCSSLTDVYFPALKREWLLFSGSSFTGVSFSGSQWEDHFPSSLKKQIRAHVWDLTASQLAELKNSAIWCDFKEIVNHKSNVNYTITSDGNATINFVELKGNASYVSATGTSQLASASSGSKSGTVKSEGNYAVEIRDVDFDTKNVQLLRNGSVATLEPYEDQGQPLRYHEDLNLQQDVRYEVSVSDKVCTVSFAQTGYTGRIMYQKTWNGTTSTGVITAYAPTVTCAQGSQLKLTIPYDQYTPNVLRLNGSTVSMTKANGEAIATITVPAAATAEVDLTWQAPQQQDPPHHQPEIMIMRSGEGDILFKGMCMPEPQAAEAYEQQFGYPAENGIVVSALSNCSNTVTTVTVPDYDYLGRGEGYEFDATEWGFRAEITPVAGQTLKTLLVGYIDEEEGRETIIWEDMLYGENYGMYVHPEYRYVNYNESTNTYTLNWGFDEMNIWIGDYVVNIAMGPEETAVETGATLNFVRQGGRTEVLFEKEDVDGTLYPEPIEEGSTVYHLKYFTQAELDDAGMNYYQVLWFHPVDGETIHVFCDGTDITSQLIYDSKTGNARLDLERKNHTYTLLIDDAPDANPTWTIMQGGGMVGSQVVVTRNGEDETTAIDGSAVMLPIDDEGVEKVTLRVPVGTAVPVTKYQIQLESIAYGTGTRVVGYLMASCSMDRPSANALVESLPGLIPTQYDSEADAQPIVDGFAEMGAVAVVVPVATSATQVIPNNTPIRVMRNGQEVTFQMDFSDPQYAAFEVPVTSLTDVMWEVSYDTSHRQTILRKGGTGAVEIGYQYIGEEAITRSADGGMTTIDLPSFHWQRGNFVEFAVEAVEGEKVKICRNGEDVTSVFGEPQSLVGKKWYYISSYSNNTQDELGFQLRDPAVWEITIEEDGNQTDVNYMFIGNYNYLTAYADYNEGYEYEGSRFHAENVEGYCIGKVVENGSCINEEMGIDFQMQNPNDTFRAFRNGVDVTNQFSKGDNNIWTFTSNDPTMHEPAQWIIVADNDLSRYDVNRDGSITIADVTKLVNKILGKE